MDPDQYFSWEVGSDPLTSRTQILHAECRSLAHWTSSNYNEKKYVPATATTHTGLSLISSLFRISCRASSSIIKSYTECPINVVPFSMYMQEKLDSIKNVISSLTVAVMLFTI